jgi:hypothetical protein
MKLKLFLIGISVFFCCCQNDIDFSETYVFENKSNKNVRSIGYVSYLNDTIPNEQEVFNIFKNSNIKIYSTGLQVSRRKDGKPFSVFPFNIIGFDSIAIFFDDKRKLNYSLRALLDDCSIPNNLYCRESYTVKEISRFEYEYTYTFTEGDYRNATPLVFGEGFVGSVWRCTEGAGLQEGLLYNELRFVSESEVQGWVQLEGESEPEWFFNATYSIEGETLTISDDGDSFTAVLNEDYTGLITNIDGEGECVFVKQ